MVNNTTFVYVVIAVYTMMIYNKQAQASTFAMVMSVAMQPIGTVQI